MRELGFLFTLIVHRRETEATVEGRMIVSSAESALGQRVEDTVRSARENSEPRESRQRRRETCLQNFYYRTVFCCDRVIACTVRKEINSTARKT